MRLLLPVAALASVNTASAGPVAPIALIPGYSRTAYSVRDGAPGAVTSLAQTRDGFLWIGSDRGLWRFDGVKFERRADLEKRSGIGVRTLFVASNGDLWIGYGFDGVALSRAGRLVQLPRQHAPSGWTEGFGETPDGTVWTISAGSLFSFGHGRWRRYDFPVLGDAYHLQVDSRGILWLCFDKDDVERLVRIDPRDMRPIGTVVSTTQSVAMGTSPAGDVLLADEVAIRRPVVLGNKLNLVKVSPLPGRWPDGSIAAGEDGELWLAGASRRIFHVPAGGSLDGSARLFEADPGSADYSTTPFRDREGNWWIGTKRGIDRFHPVDAVENSIADPVLGRVRASGVHPFQVIADSTGTVFARINRRLFRIEANGRATALPTLAGLDYNDGVCAGLHGGLWIRTAARTISLVAGDRRRTATLPADSKTPVTTPMCEEDGEGRLWVGTTPAGLLRYDADDRNPVLVPYENHPGGIPYLTGLDSRGRLLAYAGYHDLLVFDGGAFRKLIGEDDNPFSFIGALSPRPDELLIGGEGGLGLLSHGRLAMIRADRSGVLGNISGLIQNAHGETWLLSQAGLMRLPSAALLAKLRGGRAALPYRLFDVDDGVLARSDIEGFTGVVEARNGRLWFSDDNGIYSLDPRHLTRNRLPPTVIIRGVVVDGQTIAPSGHIRLPAGSRELQIDFTATSLGVPSRVRFRYQLTGVDPGWIDAGARRQAFYTNLGPGEFTFRVLASNDDGVWSPAASTMVTTIPPTFVQSVWFMALCTLLAAVLGWLAYTARVQHLRRRYDQLLRERLDERERIARDLHDTLLQALQGLLLRFHAVAAHLPPDTPVRRSLDVALDRAEGAIVEGRNRVRDLRGETSEGSLEERIKASIGSAGEDSEVPTSLTVEGSPRATRRRVADEVVGIVDEALRNAHRHAGAGTIEVVLTFEPARLTVVVRDDGRGMSDEIVARRRREGHFGLVGMDERARVMGGELSVSTKVGGGTEVVLRIPGCTAYLPEECRPSAPIRWLRKLRGVGTEDGPPRPVGTGA